MYTTTEIPPVSPKPYPDQSASVQGGYMHPFGWHAAKRMKAFVAVCGWAIAGKAITIQEISLGKGVLRRHSPLTLFPHISDCGKYFTVALEGIDMEITETSVEGLRNAVEAVLGMKWKRYAEGDPAKMTLGAQAIRDHLIRMYRYDPGK